MEESLAPGEMRLAYTCQFAGDEALSREAARRCCEALQRKAKERRRDELQAAIRSAERDGDQPRLADLLRTKAKLAAELAQRGQP